MRKIITGVIFAACALASAGGGSVYGDEVDRDKGYEQADRKRQGRDEDIKRAQGNEAGVKFIHDNKSHQDE